MANINAPVAPAIAITLSINHYIRINITTYTTGCFTNVLFLRVPTANISRCATYRRD